MSKIKVKRKRLKTNTSTLYIVTSLIFLVILLFFLTSRMLIDEETPVKNSELNVVHKLPTKGEAIINDWSYDENKNMMEVFLTLKKVRDYDADLTFSSVSRVNRTEPLDTKVVYQEDNTYVILIRNVPKNFEQVALNIIKTSNSYSELMDEDDDKEVKEELVMKLYTDQRLVNMQVIDELSVKQYAIIAIDKTTDDLERDKGRLEDLNNKIDKSIEMINSQIEEKEEEKVYQTAEEQLETSASIHSLQYKIQEMESEKESNMKLMEINDRRIEKLSQKRNDLELNG